MAETTKTVGVNEELIARLPWLDDVAKSLEQLFEPVLGQEAPHEPRDFLYGTWLGHPLHPAVVAIPLGAWSAAAVFDLLGEQRAADLLVGLGLAGAAGSAVTGAAQWQDTTNDLAPRRLGTLHALLNVAATGLMAGSLLMRGRGRRGTGHVLSTAGLGISLASAWLGGDLAYDLGIGVDHAAFEKPPTKWKDVAALEDLQEGKPLRVQAGSAPILLLRRGNRIQAIGATCSHLGGPLDKGKIEGNTVTCPWHASVFCLDDGAVIHGPATTPEVAYEVKVENGRVSVRANAANAGGTIPVSEAKQGEKDGDSQA